MSTGIYGRPGMGLSHHTHYGNQYTRTAGSAGEFTTARVLDAFWDQAAIFHDLSTPNGGNIDHAVLTGNKLLLIDSKNWAAGRYWSVGPYYFRDWESREAPSNNVADTHWFLSRHLQGEGIRIPKPLVALWSGAQCGSRSINLGPGRQLTVPVEKHKAARPFLHYRYPGARMIPGNDLAAIVARFIGRRPADPHWGAVSTLNQLITK